MQKRLKKNAISVSICIDLDGGITLQLIRKQKVEIVQNITAGTKVKPSDCVLSLCISLVST